MKFVRVSVLSMAMAFTSVWTHPAPDVAPLYQPFRISEMGPGYWAEKPAFAYNTNAAEYLVVWAGRDAERGAGIYGQRVDAATGAQVGPDDLLIDGTLSAASDFAVAYNAAIDEYLVVWRADGNTDWNRDDFDLFGRRITGAGVPIGMTFAVTVTPTQPIRDPGCGSLLFPWCYPEQWQFGAPAVAHNPANGQYVVAYQYAQPMHTASQGIALLRLDAQGAAIGRTFVQSEAASVYPTLFGNPVVAHNTANNEYLVAWARQDLMARRVDGDTGAVVGSAFAVADRSLLPQWPRIAYNANDNEFLVVWHGSDGVRVFGQRLSAAGVELGASDFPISGGDISGRSPSVACEPMTGEYLGCLACRPGRIEHAPARPAADGVGQRSRPERFPHHPHSVASTGHVRQRRCRD